MFQPKTFLDICFAMKTMSEVELGGEIGIIKSIEREDGSGRNWNVTLSCRVVDEDYASGFCKCKDIFTVKDRQVFFAE
jgi:hypothetical protein